MKNLKKVLITGTVAAVSVIVWALFLNDKKKGEEIDKDFDEIFDCDDEHTSETYQKPESLSPLENQNIDEEKIFEDMSDSVFLDL